MTAIKVFLADDQKTVLAYLRDELGDKFEIAGTAASGEEAVADCGAYRSVEEVVEAALTAVEQRTVPGFAGTPEELDTVLAEGLASTSSRAPPLDSAIPR